jgi:D-cysteine desulfhydrase
VVYAAGSGGTGAGLVLGVKLRKLPWRVIGVNVCDDRDYFVRVIGEIVEEAITTHGLDLEFSRDEIEIVDGYVGAGYAKSRPEELRLIGEVARSEALILDPVYTGKAFYGLARELERDPRAFGERIVFVHTGGIFGLFPKASEIDAAIGEG